MSLDVEFDTLVEDRVQVADIPALGEPSTALAMFDAVWYIKASRRARRMDLVGDYAGNEMFVIDGDSLLQEVLDDPLLALGRTNESSFQILHAFRSLERLLMEFDERNAVFEVVFWEDARHIILQRPLDNFVFASLNLARTMLIEHLKRLDIPVHCFRGLSDSAWRRYRLLSKPMFIMLNDGGTFESDRRETSPSTVQSILMQRVRVFNFVTRGLSCALLRGTTFRDSKIVTFIHEQRLDPKARSGFPRGFWGVVTAASQSLTQLNSEYRAALTPDAQNILPSREPLDRFLELGRAFIQDKGDLPLFALQMFVAHLVLLPLLSIQERSRTYDPLHPELENYIRNAFLPTIFLLCEASQKHAPDMDIDGRIFRDILRFVLSHPELSLAEAVGDTVATKVEQLWARHHLPPVPVAKFVTRYPLPPTDVSPDTDVAAELQLLPFSNLIFDEVLVDAHIDAPQAAEDIPNAEMDFNTIFHDAQHWHNHRRALLPKHLGGEDKLPVLTDWQKKRQLRSEQRFTAKLQWQAESLTGAWGKALKQISIVTGTSTTATSHATQAKPTVVQSKGKDKKVHVSKAEQIRLQNTARKLGTQDESNVTWWKAQLETISILSTENKISAVDRLLANSARADSGWLSVELRLYRLNLEFRAWVEDPDADSDEVERQDASRDKHTVFILRMVKELSERGGLFPSARHALESILCCLGFADYTPGLLGTSPSSTDDRKLSFSFIKLVRSKTKAPVYKYMPIVEDLVVWQLRVFGEYMDRSMDSQPDRRVAFNPDAWQRQVLDYLDDVDEDQNLNHSVLVVAPTSAGKTFISYYAMEQILRRSDDEILVYVAPTKALVSQIAAEVYARFSKSYKAVGKSLWAIHTRDYRVHSPQNCQILVTVPEMLAIMLLSPQLSRQWTPRIKRIILDEIHSIGQQEGGAVWEQIILLAPCPIVGLSATIGEAERFNAWLASVQEAHGFRHSFIQHPHRYSHLRKFIYNLQDTSRQVFSGTDSYNPTGRLRFLHPVSLLSFGARSLPSDFSLESADCLTLYKAFTGIGKRKVLSDLSELDPTSFFSRGRLLRQKDILAYEVALKEKLDLIMKSSDPQDSSSLLARIVAELQDPVVGKLSTVEQNTNVSVKTVMDNIIFLLSDLHVTGDLPAIVFSFDRSACEFAARKLVETLEGKESQWRETSSEWQRKIQQWEKWKSQAAAREKQAERLRKQKKDPSEGPGEASVDASWESSFDPADPSPQFSFLGKRCSKAILNETIEDIRWALTLKQQWVLDPLRRGIGIHHAGMNKHYRTAVESLYRMGYIQVVIATGTLALGINAPTRTSVFFGDSPYLTALMYRQCAGRAGRRGYDLLGKVVFYALPLERIQRLVLSKLPSIGGNFPLTSTMVLRLFNLLQGSDYAPIAVNAIKSLLGLPQVSFVLKTGKQEILHHVRFSIDYLRRSGLLDASGNPINLFGLAAHLYYTEPSNFALVTLMRQGVLHEVCNQPSTETAKRNFLQLMCHIFGRRPLPAIYTSEMSRIRLNKSPSKVVLSRLPESARRTLVQHDREILRIFTSYAIAYGSRLLDMDGPETRLPLSGLEYNGKTEPSPSVFRTYLGNTHIKVNARSPFVANSGHDDRFHSVAELSQTCRNGLHLNEHGVPSMQEFTRRPEDDKDTLPLNAYLLDFYMHGQTAALVAANGIRLGELWYLLEDFTLTLKTIRSTVELLLLRTRSNEATAEASLEDEVSIAGVNGAETDMDEGLDGETSVARPPGVSNRDWRVFEVVDMVTKEFEEKFKAMWA